MNQHCGSEPIRTGPVRLSDGRDQAATLRKMVTYMEQAQKNGRAPRVLAVTSGKGGVGKTNIVANLAYVLGKAGHSVFVLDADIGLANLDIMLGLAPEFNLQHVLNGEKKLSEIIIEGPGGIKILPASSGVQELSELTQDQKLMLLSEFGTVTDSVDFFIIDTGAGISSNVMYFNLAAQDKIVVVTPEPTSITDAYAIIKVMATKYAVKRFMLVANNVRDANEADALYCNVSTVAERFLNVSLEYLGYIENDTHIPLSVRSQKLVSILHPTAPASLSYVRLAKKIQDLPLADSPGGGIGFFWDNLLVQQSHKAY